LKYGAKLVEKLGGYHVRGFLGGLGELRELGWQECFLREVVGEGIACGGFWEDWENWENWENWDSRNVFAGGCWGGYRVRGFLGGL